MSRLDLLIVGGGPAGTAAAFRAKELGLEPLVIDYDDLMKRIRDYSKDKLILPGFGGADRVPFPRGGELVGCLVFEPIDKDDMCSRWKQLYREHGVAHEVGVELTGLAPLDDGGYRAVGWNHVTGCECSYQARHVVLALGRGVPRRFDVPGNTEGITYRLADPAALVGEPALVIGGGTSAAEAVIALSNAKAEASDPTAVYWSYRGDKMPRVSKALADVFFSAYVGNGNIRYYRRSEPVAVFTGDDRREYLAVRVDRRSIPNRPNEVELLEFPKENVVACIGEDLPRALLGSLGIEMVTGGPKAKQRMVVSPLLESCRPNVYLVGDLLSQAYFETDDFASDPAGFREVRHRGNIKSALRDGVLVAQVIQQRLAGKSEIDLEVAEADLPPPAAPVATPAAAPAADGPPAASLEPGREVEDAAAVLVRLLPTGVEAEEHTVRRHGVTTIGRHGCDLEFPSDSLLDDRHASISHGEDGYWVRDDGGASGVFLRVPPGRKRALGERDVLRAGRQFLLVERDEAGFVVAHYDAEGRLRGRHAVGAQPLLMGRDAPGAVLDAGDRSLSRRHLALAVDDGALTVKDLKSVNGTHLRVRSALRLEHGDQLRVGQQQLVFSRRRDEAIDDGASPGAAAPAAAAPAEGTAAGVTVAFRGAGGPLAVADGQTVCEVAEAHGLPINAECHSGICGSDPIRILAGHEHLAGEPGDQERETLEEICDLEPGPCRLACMVRVSGPVEVELIEPKE